MRSEALPNAHDGYVSWEKAEAIRQMVAFGGLRVDDAIEQALLTVVGPGAITAV
jgi:hypothetical protein